MSATATPGPGQPGPMRAFVIVATKARPREASTLLDALARQELRPHFTMVVGAQPADIAGLSEHPLIKDGGGQAIVSPRTGSSAQRNTGLEAMRQAIWLGAENSRFFCAFFDDDFRPAPGWLARAAERFCAGDAVGLTGRILADGVKHGGLDEDDAVAWLRGERPPQPHWASGNVEFPVASVYGCNMAFVDAVVSATRFDEMLPLYSWQEDRDYTARASRLGPVFYFPGCEGVHLGVPGARVSGIQFGYSQVANLVYLMGKKTVGRAVGTKMIARAVCSNLLRSARRHRLIDYRGRLRGNAEALLDIIHSRCSPLRILEQRPSGIEQ